MILTVSQIQEVPLSLMKIYHCIKLQKSHCPLCDIPCYLLQNKIMIQKAHLKETLQSALRQGTQTLQERERSHLISQSAKEQLKHSKESRIQQVCDSV